MPESRKAIFLSSSCTGPSPLRNLGDLLSASTDFDPSGDTVMERRCLWDLIRRVIKRRYLRSTIVSST
jgi:hypothetical protein